MNLTLDDVREILEKEYYRDNIKFLFERLFSDFREVNILIDIPNKFKEIRQIGESSSIGINIYEVQLTKKIEKQKVGVTREMFKILKALNEYNSIVVFVNEDKNNYRLSLLTTSITSEGGKIKKEFSNPRRYSYYLGKGTKTKTIYDFLYLRESVTSLDELRDRFSIDIVNEQFYSKISLAFTKLIGGSFSGVTYDRVLYLPRVTNPNKYSEFGVRLLGRLIFCWFLKEKKSENGLSLIPDILFSKEMIDRPNTNYYNDVLQSLFFETLNTPMENRDESVKNEYFNLIPYLNGGLFSPNADDFYEKIGDKNVWIPNIWFKELFETLDQYNFTVDESTSYDVELSIDPEMLGRIFENLLAEINPETGESARHNTGSFYTPRDIVDFMVNTSLYEHLVNDVHIEHRKVESLIEFGISDEIDLSDEERSAIVDSLYNIKILDPACGSGAFPMGLLQKIVYILQEVDPDNILWLEKIDNDKSIDKKTKQEIEWSSIDYIRKLLVIKNSIYGVDIQPIAVEISRLRCFLSIVIEEDIDDSRPNRGIRPLPNLDFKFAIGNTLIPLEKEGEKGSLFDDYDLIEQLNGIRDDWFNANMDLKEDLKKHLSELQTEMIDSISDFSNLESTKYRRLIHWHPYKTEENDWFDSEWMFGVNKFDIVIGNPPYIRLQNRFNIQDPNDTTNFGDVYKDIGYKTFVRTGDIYCLFYEKGLNLLRPDGILTFITSNKWMRTGYAGTPKSASQYGKVLGLRQFLANKNPLILIDFGIKVFKTATVDVNILVCQNNSENKGTYACTATEECRENLTNFVRDNASLTLFNSSQSWIISSPIVKEIKKKVEKMGTPLNQWNISFYRGILTGLNEAFVIDGTKRKQLIQKDPKSAEIIHPLLRGRNIKRYSYTFPDSWIIIAHNGNPDKGVDRIHIKDYPAIKEHLDNYYDQLVARDDQGDTPYNLRSCAYIDEFSKPKILYPALNQGSSFIYDEEGFFGVNSTFFIVGEHIEFLTAFLNSKLFEFCFRENFASLGQKGSDFRMEYFYDIPVIEVNNDTNEWFKEKVREIQNASKNNNSEEFQKLDNEINDRIFGLYRLTESDISAIESSFSDVE